MVFGLFLRSTWVQSPWNSKAASAGLRKGGVWNLISRPGPGGRLGSHQLDGLGGALNLLIDTPCSQDVLYILASCALLFFSVIYLYYKRAFLCFFLSTGP